MSNIKKAYMKGIARGLIAAFAIALVITGSFAVAPDASAQATATRVVTRGEFEPYVKVDAGGFLKERVYYDVVTATKVCNLLGYTSGKVFGYSNWDSPSNNTAAYWNGTTWIQTQGARPGYMDSVTCTGLPSTVPPVVASCNVNPAQVNIGDSMTFSITASGGNGTYAYLWSGTDGLNGTGQSISKVYSTSGTKSASVQVTSGGQSKTITCSGVVNPAVVLPTVSGSCVANNTQPAIGDTVVFTATATGGNGTYTYAWSGTNGLAGNGLSTNIIYPSAGTKTATVVISSNGHSVTRSCTTQVAQAPTQTPALLGSCLANAPQANIGDTVTFYSSVAGGTGSYTYSWSGTDGLSATGSQTNKSYTTSGTKSASVVITSGNQSVTRNCSVVIQPAVVTTDPALLASCLANVQQAYTGDTVTFYSNAAGGNGNYTYSWSGTDGLTGSGSSASQSYSSSGTKNASVVITSGNQSVTRNCSTNIIQTAQTNYNLDGSCYASVSSANIGDTITFNAQANGGNGGYTYSWSGTDGLYGSGTSVSRSYSGTGYKTATVTIYSNGQSVSRNCNVQINNYNNNGGGYTYNAALNASCAVNPTNVTVGGNVSWYVNSVVGGNGYYTYSWSGTDGLYGTGNYIYKNYTTPGYKTATVTIYSDGQAITRSCTVLVGQYYGGTTYNNTYVPPTTYTGYNSTYYVVPPGTTPTPINTYSTPTTNYTYPTNTGNGVSLTLDQTTAGNGYVSLSNVPYTGLDNSTKIILLIVGLILWSLVVTYAFVIHHRRTQGE